MRVKVIVCYSLLYRGKQYYNKVGEIIDVKKNKLNFTEVLVRFENGDEVWSGPAILEITHKRIGD